MTDNLEVTIVAEDFKNTSYFSPWDCPLARGIARTLGLKDVYNGYNGSSNYVGVDRESVKVIVGGVESNYKNGVFDNVEFSRLSNIMMENPNHTYTINLAKIN